MDRNDYYGGASTSLNLIQVHYNQIRGLSFQLIKVFIPFAKISVLIFNMFHFPLPYSFGSVSGGMISLQNSWA